MANVSKFQMQVASLDELKAIFASLLADDTIRKVRSDELTASEVASLNRHVVGNSFSCYVPAERSYIETLLGVRVCSEGDNPTITIAGTGYVFDNNKFNRPISMSRIAPYTKPGTYSNLQSRGLWTTSSGVLVYDWGKQIVSAQHTLISLLIVAITNPDSLKDLYLHCYFGLPPQFKDNTDKGRARNKIQDSYSDDTLFPETLFEEIQLERTPEGNERIKERTGLLKLRSKIASNCLNRFRGKDISKTGDKLSWNDEKAFTERFFDATDLDRLALKIWEAAKSPSGKQDRTFTQLFELSVIGTGLVLASNREEILAQEIEANVTRKDSDSPEEYAERKLSYRSSLMSDDAHIRLDWDLVDNVLALLSESTDNSGTLGTVFGDLFERKAKDKRNDKFSSLLYSKLSIASMSAFVELVKNILAGQVSASVWTSYRIVDNKAPTSYRCFGGLDVGYVNSRKSKKDSDE